MKVEEIMLTPALATKLLEGNTKNRRLSPRRVKSLAAALTGGEYQFDGTPIRIAPDGTVLDGQHRLEAVRLSGVTIQVLLITGLDPAVQMVMDTGKPRNFPDWLKIHEVPNATNVAGAATLLWHYEHGHLQSGSSWSYRPTPTHTGLWAFFQVHEEEIGRAIRESGQVRKKIRIAPSVAAVGGIVLARIDEEDAEAFYSQLRFDSAQGPQAAAFTKLLNARRERFARDFTQQEQFALLLKTWNLYRKNAVVTFLRWRQSGPAKENFPLPDGEEGPICELHRPANDGQEAAA